MDIYNLTNAPSFFVGAFYKNFMLTKKQFSLVLKRADFSALFVTLLLSEYSSVLF